MKIKITKILFAVFLSTYLFVPTLAVKAADLQIIKNNSAAYQDGSYQFSDIEAMAVDIAQMILQVVAVLTFIMFIYGGFLFLSSAGNQQTVGTAKKVLLAAIIGLVIVFTSYTLVDFFEKTLKPPTNQTK